MQGNGKLKTYALAYTAFFIYSMSAVFLKLAAHMRFLSPKFTGLYLLSLLLLVLYAALWQKVLKHAPLTSAYAHKSITLLFGMAWGAVLFQEPVKWNMLLGALLVAGGVALVARDEK